MAFSCQPPSWRATYGMDSEYFCYKHQFLRKHQSTMEECRHGLHQVKISLSKSLAHWKFDTNVTRQKQLQNQSWLKRSKNKFMSISLSSMHHCKQIVTSKQKKSKYFYKQSNSHHYYVSGENAKINLFTKSINSLICIKCEHLQMTALSVFAIKKNTVCKCTFSFLFFPIVSDIVSSETVALFKPW